MISRTGPAEGIPAGSRTPYHHQRLQLNSPLGIASKFPVLIAGNPATQWTRVLVSMVFHLVTEVEVEKEEAKVERGSSNMEMGVAHQEAHVLNHL